MNILNIEQARAARDAVLEQIGVWHRSWMNCALATVKILTLPAEFTAEDIRIAVVPIEGAPANPHAWGALTKALLKAGVIEETGKLTPMRDARSHGRRTMVYRRTDVQS